MNIFNKNNIKKIIIILLIVFFLNFFIVDIHAGGGSPPGGSGACSCTLGNEGCIQQSSGPSCNSGYSAFCVQDETCSWCSCVDSCSLCTNDDNDGYFIGIGLCEPFTNGICPSKKEGDCVDKSTDCNYYSGLAKAYCQDNVDNIHPGTSENNPTKCSNNIDDDCDDGMGNNDFFEYYCDSFHCLGTGIDCADNGCDGIQGSPDGQKCEYGEEKTCSDDFDNDRDGQIDCDDSDCDDDLYCNPIVGECPSQMCYDSTTCAFNMPSSVCDKDNNLECINNNDCIVEDPNEGDDDYGPCITPKTCGYSSTNFGILCTTDSDCSPSEKGSCESQPTCKESCMNFGVFCTSSENCENCVSSSWPDCGSYGVSSQPGPICSEGLFCLDGACVDLTCRYGLTTFDCNCEGEPITIGEYCCKSGSSSDPCEDIKLVQYKWNPIDYEIDYCNNSEMGCPQPNPFTWQEKYHNTFTFLDEPITNFFEVIPLFNNLYNLIFYHEDLTTNLITQDIPLNSDNLADYPLHIKDFTAYGLPNYYFCAQEDSYLGEISSDKIWDVGVSDDQDSLKVFCRNHIIRLCLSEEPCYWDSGLESADDKTCNLPDDYMEDPGGEGYAREYPQFARNDDDFEGIEIPSLAESGTGKFYDIWCKEDYLGYSEGWYGSFMPNEEFEFELLEDSEHILKGNFLYTLENQPTYPFCDQDNNVGQCGAPSCNYIGYDPLPEWEHEQSWDDDNKKCMGDDYIAPEYYENPPTEEQIDYRPDFLYQTVDEPDLSSSFCINGPIGANYDKRAWVSGMTSPGYCCGDDDGSLYYPFSVDGNLEEPEPLGFNNYNDCSKLVNNKYLCNAPIGETSAKWEDATMEGDIVYIPCYPATIGTEFVSDGETWISCGQHSLINPDAPELSPHQFTGPSFSSQEQRIGQNYKHSYICQDTIAITGENSIAECCGSDCYSEDQGAGERENTGGWKETINGDRFYCAIDTDKNSAETIISTESTESTLWTLDIDLTNSFTCIGAGYKWTGKIPYHTFALYSDFSSHENFCCGDYDDIQSFTNGDSKLLYESYNDPNGLGACFNATIHYNNQPINHNNKEYNETFVIGGTIKGCAIDKESAISSSQCSGELGLCDSGIPYTNDIYSDSSKPFKTNKWLSELYDWPDPGHFNNIDLDLLPSLIKDNNYCSIISLEDSDYYCDYTEDWKLVEEEELPTHLSFVEWETDAQKAGCCLPEQCWNGETCIDTQHNNPMLFYETEEGPYRCIYGAWQPATLKYTWDKEQSGYCQYDDQCLVNPSGAQGDPNNPQCINSNLFIGDHFCEEGNWTTRTKFIALQLLDIPSSNQPYTLYCDSYQNTLNKYDYNDLESFILYPRTMNGSTFSSVNNFCILRYGEDDKVIIATSLNHDILNPNASFLTAFEQEILYYPTGHQGFEVCQSSPDYIYYNEEINSIIYSKHPLQLNSPFNNFLDFFQDIFETIISFFTSGPVSGNSIYEFIEQTSDFDQIYISNQEQIVAIKERVWPTQEHISILYQGLGADVCETVEVYDDKLGSTNSIDCEEDNGIYYVASTLPEGINIWSLTTAKLRPQIAK